MAWVSNVCNVFDRSEEPSRGADTVPIQQTRVNLASEPYSLQARGALQ